MLSGYVPVLVMICLAALIAGGMVGASYLLGPKKPTRFKADTYECGMTPIGNARERFPVKFYLVAMLFILFDIETIFLYPWVVTFHDATRTVKLFNLAEMAVFVGILFVGYFYVLGRGALDWNEGRETERPLDRKIFARRKPIRFGNEESGAVRLPDEPSEAARKSA